MEKPRHNARRNYHAERQKEHKIPSDRGKSNNDRKWIGKEYCKSGGGRGNSRGKPDETRKNRNVDDPAAESKHGAEETADKRHDHAGEESDAIGKPYSPAIDNITHESIA